MPEQCTLPVADLALDLENYRILPQANELDTLKAIVGINPDRFWALVTSLVEDGFYPTENLLVLKGANGDGTMVVKEGNRRVSAIKLLLGLLNGDDLIIPTNHQKAMAGTSEANKISMSRVPCLLYEPAESAELDKCITRIHGKGDQASRTKWSAVAKARHNRHLNPDAEPGLDLLEDYLASGRNLTDNQREHWAGEFPITILDEALQKLAPRLGLKNGREVQASYAKSPHREAFERMLYAIGEETLSFIKLRDDKLDALSLTYGFPAPAGGATAPPPATPDAKGKAGKGKGAPVPPPAPGGKPNPLPAPPPAPAPVPSAPKKPNAKATTDPASVIRALKKLKPKGPNRDKVVTLANEAARLNLGPDGHPHAFCFLLRSMFEISAKAYCDDHPTSGLTYMEKGGTRERDLASILTDVTNHLTAGPGGKKDPAVLKRLKGALTDLSNPDGILSVNSMNQLIHNPRFTVDGAHIALVFNNVFPLLEALNQ